VTPRDPTDEDRYALYEHAHHDLWWAKAQEWNVANWALLLIAGNVAIARTLISENYLAFRTAWPFWIINALIPLAATWYLSSLHANIVHDREVYRELELQTGVKKLREQLREKGLQDADERSDRTRGLKILCVMAGVFAVGSAFGVLFMGASTSVAILTGVALGALNAVILWRAV
jgi:hypothetical protein